MEIAEHHPSAVVGIFDKLTSKGSHLPHADKENAAAPMLIVPSSAMLTAR
jgi:hypothetical protein